MKHISQNVARTALKRVKELETAFRNQRVRVYPQWGGTLIDTLVVSNTEAFIVRTAQKCGHAVFVSADDAVDKLRLYALPHFREDI